MESITNGTMSHSEKVEKEMEDAGASCERIEGRKYAGTPFYVDGTCVYLANGAMSVCDSIRFPNIQPLCYCRGK